MVDLDTLGLIIDQYKLKFAEIHKEEIYKWKAVKHFQDHWNPDAEDFKNMLLQALYETRMLMDAKRFFPKEMLTTYLNEDPITCKKAFLNLFDEEQPLSIRLHDFLVEMSLLKQTHTPKLNSFQDIRVALVYLNLRYPESYFLYKYRMLKDFAKMISYPVNINVRDNIGNGILFQDLCKIVLIQVLKDDDLLKLHHQRLKAEHYADPGYHLLTQDIIYAATKYFTETIAPQRPFLIDLVEDQSLEVNEYTPSLVGRQIDFINKAQAQKWIGDLGEQAVLQYEQQRLRANSIYDKVPILKSKQEGDGVGYDILSYDLDRKPIYIEVKTTRSSSRAGFYITESELQKSIKEKDRYRLYRLYQFDEKKKLAKLIIRKGSLKELCINPTGYFVPFVND